MEQRPVVDYSGTVWRDKKKRGRVGPRAVLITDCRCPVGRELAKKLDKLGFYVFAGWSGVDEEGARRLQSASSNRLRLVRMEPEQLSTAVETVRQDLPEEKEGLYCLVEIGAGGPVGSFIRLSSRRCRSALEKNLIGRLLVISHFLPLLKSGKGRIVGVCSDYGRYAYPGMSVQCCTHAALMAFFRCLDYELVPFNLQVFLIEERSVPIDQDQEAEETEQEQTNNSRGSGCPKAVLKAIEQTVMDPDPPFHCRVLAPTLRMRVLSVIQWLPASWARQIIKRMFYAGNRR